VSVTRLSDSTGPNTSISCMPMGAAAGEGKEACDYYEAVRRLESARRAIFVSLVCLRVTPRLRRGAAIPPRRGRRCTVRRGCREERGQRGVETGGNRKGKRKREEKNGICSRDTVNSIQSRTSPAADPRRDDAHDGHAAQTRSADNGGEKSPYTISAKVHASIARRGDEQIRHRYGESAVEER
jgi:hypothetical protein